jgi:glutaredoxin
MIRNLDVTKRDFISTKRSALEYNMNHIFLMDWILPVKTISREKPKYPKSLLIGKASWCGHCKDLMSTLKQKDFDAYTINLIDENPSLSTSSNAGSSLGSSKAYPQGHPNRMLLQTWGVNGYPTIFVSGSDGSIDITSPYQGPRDVKSLIALLSS